MEDGERERDSPESLERWGESRPHRANPAFAWLPRVEGGWAPSLSPSLLDACAGPCGGVEEGEWGKLPPHSPLPPFPTALGTETPLSAQVRRKGEKATGPPLSLALSPEGRTHP